MTENAVSGKRRKIKYRLTPVFFAAAATMALGGCAGKEPPGLEDAIQETGAYVRKTTPAPGISSIGGEWAVIALQKGGVETEDYYYESYYDNVRAQVKSSGGILSEDTYTEYARVVLALCAIGEDPANVEGYDLTEPLDDYRIVTDQGINAAAFALLAAYTVGVSLENEENYLDYIVTELEQENMYTVEDASDYVAIALEGLAFYQERTDVKAAVEKGIKALSGFQDADGGFGNCESTAEAIIALTQLGIDVTKDSRFIKDGHSLQDGLMEYYIRGGGFCHVAEEKEPNAMATEKALLALDAIRLFEDGKTLYEREGE
ncbi:MAG TPA: hypothetical protein IAA08_11075 [Candidatus Eubacterium avistercoris]|uniref:Squalene cyclase C-terminal domain-containing protein n=1 Tax=Candidatus Eubacterium avistercoris TaxID=2838567 RepID=A0A9D2D4P1_9FIRM|nr:hypothetical protein [Candidatus Eubacterium avistercoris]